MQIKGATAIRQQQSQAWAKVPALLRCRLEKPDDSTPAVAQCNVEKKIFLDLLDDVHSSKLIWLSTSQYGRNYLLSTS